MYRCHACGIPQPNSQLYSATTATGVVYVCVDDEQCGARVKAHLRDRVVPLTWLPEDARVTATTMRVPELMRPIDKIGTTPLASLRAAQTALEQVLAGGGTLINDLGKIRQATECIDHVIQRLEELTPADPDWDAPTAVIPAVVDLEKTTQNLTDRAAILTVRGILKSHTDRIERLENTVNNLVKKVDRR